MEIYILFFFAIFKVKIVYLILTLFISIHIVGNITVYKSEIHLIIKSNGEGEQKILNNTFYLNPSEVIINGETKNTCGKNCVLEKGLNNVTLKFNGLINSCENMFKELNNIIEIDLSNLDTSDVTTMASMFEQCSSLEKINFGKINTSSVTSMFHLFHQCTKLASIDVSNFDTSQVTSLNSIFRFCESLTSIDVSNFNTKNVVDMLDIFSFCYNLTSADLSNFDTSKVTYMRGIFYRCYKLKRLDLSNFNTSLVSNIVGMFQDSTSLVYINLYSFIIKSDTITTGLFSNTPSNLKICINDEETKHILQSYNKVFNCSDKCFKENIKIDLKENICVENCMESEYKYEYDNYCYEKCPNETFVTDNNNNGFLCVDKNKIDNYYYDNDKKVYKECFNTCKKCNKGSNETNNNCIECKSGFIFLNNSLKVENCYKQCPYYYYFNEFNNYICTEDKSCSGRYNKLIREKNKCIDECSEDDIYKYEYNYICYDHCPNETNNNNFSCIEHQSETAEINTGILKQDENIDKYRDFINDDGLIDDIINSKQDFVKSDENITYQITTSENQKNNTNNNISSINLGKCENILKDKYNINKTLPLIIFKIDYYPPDTLIPIVGYEIYHPTNKSKLDLTYCKDILIKLNIPTSIDENNLFKYDPNSGFYTDNCYSYTTENGTDIILNDRKKEFQDNNLSLCQNSCEYTGYNKDNKQSTCECDIKNKMDYISEIIDEPNKLGNTFNINETSSTSSSNIITMKCTKALFSKDGLINNISSYILFIFIFIFLLSIAIYIRCGWRILDDIIKNIIKSKKNKSQTANKQKIQGNARNNINITKNNKHGNKNGISLRISNFPPKKKKYRTVKVVKRKISKKS